LRDDPLFTAYPLQDGRPIANALRQALHEAWNQLWELAEQAGKEQHFDETLFAEYHRILLKWVELMRWVIAPDRVPALAAKPGPGALVHMLLAHDFPSALRKLGRPPSKRDLAIRVYELRVADEKVWTWSALARRFCDCGESVHGPQCQERLRREVGHLKKILSKYRIAATVPPENNR
jgi:hypothetical protein